MRTALYRIYFFRVVSVMTIAWAGYSCSKSVESSKNAASVQQPEGASNSGSGSGDATASSDIEKKFQTLLDETAKRLDDRDADLQSQIDGLKKGLAEIAARLDAAIADLNKKYDSLNDSLAKVQIDKILAEFNSVKVLVNSLQTVVNVLSTDRDTMKAQIIVLQTDVSGLRADLDRTKADLASLKVTVKDISDKLDAHIADYNAKIAALSARITSEVASIRSDMLLDSIAVQGKIATLRTDLTNLTIYTTNMEGLFNDEIARLKAKNVSQDTDLQNAINQSAINLQNAMQTEQAARGLLQSQINVLVSGLQNALTLAQTATNMATLNATNIATLNSKLDQTNADVAAMKVTFENRLQTVKDQVLAVLTNEIATLRGDLLEVSMRLAMAESRVDAGAGAIANNFIGILKTGAALVGLQNELAPLYPELDQEILSVIQFGHQVERDAIDSIDVVLKSKPGVNIDALNTSFKTAVAAACVNSVDPQGIFGSVAGFEWFFHMFRNVYVNDLIYGSRAGCAPGVDPNQCVDKIFFSKTPIVKSTGLVASLVTGMFEPYSLKTSTDCAAAIETWSRQTLYGPSATSVALRDAVASSSAVSSDVGQLFNAIDRLNVKATGFMDKLANYLSTPLGSLNAAVTYLTQPVGPGDPTPVSQVAFLLLEKVRQQAIYNELKDQRDRIYAAARNLRQATNNDANLQAQIDALNAAVALLSRAQQDTAAQVQLLTEVQRTALNIIANIASRLGYDDLVEEARIAITRIGGTLNIPNSLNACYAANHFYLHSPAGSNLATARCEGNLSAFGASPLSNVALTKCAVYNTGSNGLSYTWGNMIESPDGLAWSLEGQVSPVTGQTITKGLTLFYSDSDTASYDPTTAANKALIARTPGAYPADSKSIFGLRVIGGAKKWKIAVRSMSNSNTDPYDVTVDAAQFKVGVDSGHPDSFVYEIPVPKAVTKLGACTWNREITITPLDVNNVAGASACVHRFHTFSPVVLDFSGSGMIQTVSRLNSHAKFDLDANGVSEDTGWIRAGSALLALDINGNHKIDDGSELFGEATQIFKTGKAGANGYEALAQYDTNHDGVIDVKDEVFNKLLVWFDLNSDGKSQSYELKSLDTVGVKKIAVSYRDVPSQNVVQNDGTPEGNLVKYTAKFWGPSRCGKKGCASYDVYFGSTESMVVGTK